MKIFRKHFATAQPLAILPGMRAVWTNRAVHRVEENPVGDWRRPVSVAGPGSRNQNGQHSSASLPSKVAGGQQNGIKWHLTTAGEIQPMGEIGK